MDTLKWLTYSKKSSGDHADRLVDLGFGCAAVHAVHDRGSHGYRDPGHADRLVDLDSCFGDARAVHGRDRLVAPVVVALVSSAGSGTLVQSGQAGRS